MALESLVNQVKTGIASVPSYLKVEAVYTLTVSTGDYDVDTDTRTDPVVVTIPLTLVKGQKTDVAQATSRGLSEISPDIGESFICEARLFGDVVPDLQAQITIGTISYIISRISTDPIGLVHTFLLEKKNVFN